jgi:hypothetical protein
MDARTEAPNDNLNTDITLAAEQSARVMILEAELKRSEEKCQSYLKSLQEAQEFTALTEENSRLKDENTRLKSEITEYQQKEEAYLAAVLKAQEEIDKLKSELLAKKMMLPHLSKMFTFSHTSSTQGEVKALTSEQHSFEP